ncbi:MAG: pyridoxamine kinase [Tissierellia bacterium]|jgi:pyridoxine kinase|nr:pyridoxamine kinase [Tissierellia bacterium]MDD3751209.1 pyridoxamine kinase [Tissierellia bacterium]MDD4046166.1 pyridoxamine kinase [Tissierellia bacterium]MDD4679067.1 pyridoxamine kinase [Tissierellia bacterium]
MKEIPKIMAIQDLSGVGRCSLTVVIPIMSALGCQVCPLPTALLSNHSEYKDFYFFDFTEHMEEYYSFWEKNNFWFDCVYSGFIGSEDQINIILDIIDKVKKKNNKALIVIDPVMGDHGCTYATYNNEMITKMSHLVEKADIITPNLTEASILLGKKYCDEKITLPQVKEYLKELCNLGPKISLLTGVMTAEGKHINVCYNSEENKFWLAPFNYVNKRYPGTGDLFSSLFLGYYMKGKSLPEAMEEAARFVSLSVLISYKAEVPSSEGVIFEKIMKELYNEISEYKYTSI